MNWFESLVNDLKGFGNFLVNMGNIPAEFVGRQIVNHQKNQLLKEDEKYKATKLSRAAGQAINFAKDVPVNFVKNIDGNIFPHSEEAKRLDQAARDGIADNKIFQTKPTPSSDLLLRGAIQAEKVISRTITRPVSTLLMLAEDGSVLYKDGEFGEGFQIKDVQSAYNRSETVSGGQALAASVLVSRTPLNDLITGRRGPDAKNVNLFDNRSLEAAYVDNVVGRYFTGVSDFALSIPEFGAVGKVIKVGVGAGAKATGLTKVYEPVKFMDDVNAGLAAQGIVDPLLAATVVPRTTTSGTLIKAIADTTDEAKIFELAYNAGKGTGLTNNLDIIPWLTKATDPITVRDIIAADKGDLAAIGRLNEKFPDDLFISMGGKDALANKLAKKRGPLDADPVRNARLNRAFDANIARVPNHQKLLNTLLDPAEGNASRGWGTRTVPREPKIGNEIYAKASLRSKEIKAGLTSRDLGSIGGFTGKALGGWSAAPGTFSETLLGLHAGATTRFIKIVGTRMPNKYVSFQGVRPYDTILEFRNMFDSVRLFRNGSQKIPVVRIRRKSHDGPMDFEYTEEMTTVAAWRNEMERKILTATEPGQKFAVLEEADALMPRIAARHYDIDHREINDIINERVLKTRKAHEDFHRLGTSFDVDGTRLLTDPRTQGQLADAYRFTDWADLEREMRQKSTMVRGSVKKLESAGTALRIGFEEINAQWSFSAIGKPSYIIKQSFMEPVLGTILAMGHKMITDEVGSMANNFIFNTMKRVQLAHSKALSAVELNDLKRQVYTKSKELADAIAAKDVVQNQVGDFFKRKIHSPATVEQHRENLLRDLKAVNKNLHEVQRAYYTALKPFGKVEEVPTLTALTSRVSHLKANSKVMNTKKGRDLVNGIEKEVARLERAMYRKLPEKAELKAANEKLAKEWDKVNKALDDFGIVSKKQGLVREKSDRFRVRKHGKEDIMIPVNGVLRPFKSIFAGNMSEAIRANFKNVDTLSVNIANDLNIGLRAGVVRRTGPHTTTYVGQPLYWDELAYLMNRGWHMDPLMKQILSGVDELELKAWGITTAGKDYFAQFGLKSPRAIGNRIDENIAMAQRYLPSAAARKRVAEGDVTPNELQVLLSDYADELSDIHPLSFDYEGIADSLAGMPIETGVMKWVKTKERNIMTTMMSAENPLRMVYGDRRSRMIMAEKANILEKQGGTWGVKEYNAARQSSIAEGIRDTERTFYTVRNPIRGIFALRPITAFPTASFNAFYRYSRLSVKNPGRVLGFLHDYQGMFRSFGVDQYGNPVDEDSLLDATHIVVPGTPELGMFGGQGVRLNARSLGFLINLPGPSFVDAVAVGTVMGWKPESNTALKNALGPLYEVYFPMGTNTTWANFAIPQYMITAFEQFRGEKDDRTWMNSWMSVYEHHHMLAEKGLEKPRTSEQILEEAKALYSMKAQWSFASIFGVPAKVDTSPMLVYEQFWYLLLDKYKSKGLTGDAQDKAATEEFLARMGSDFPLDYITFKGSEARANVPSTDEAYQRVMIDNQGLVKELVALGGNDPELVSLLTTDLEVDSENRNLAIATKLKSQKTLVGGVRLNDLQLTPEQVDEQRMNNRTWDKYMVMKKATVAINKLKPGHSDDIAEALREYAKNVLAKENPLWYKSEYLAGQRSNTAAKYAVALSTITKNKEFMDKVGDDQYWIDVKTFMKQRATIAAIYNFLPARDSRKSKVLQAYHNMMEENVNQFHPKLERLITYYFSNDTLTEVP